MFALRPWRASIVIQTTEGARPGVAPPWRKQTTIQQFTVMDNEVTDSLSLQQKFKKKEEK